jgi:hypothetical protein
MVEDHEADRVQHEKCGIQPVPDAGDQDGHEGGDRCQPEIGRVLHPHQGIMPEQDVADGAAAERGNAAEHADPDPVHAAAPGGERRRHRLRRERNEREKMQHAIAGRQVPHRNLKPDLRNRNLRRRFPPEQDRNAGGGTWLVPEPLRAEPVVYD